MLLNVAHCFNPQLIVLFLLIAETNQNTISGNAVVSKSDDTFFPHIFKFLYKNEQLCKLAFAFEMMKFTILITINNN